MKKLLCKYTLLILITVIAVLLPSNYSSAEEFNIAINGNDPIILDNAGILSEYDKVNILDKANELRNDNGFQYIILTTSDLSDYNNGHELESIYYDCHEWITADGTVLFLMSLDSKRSFCEIQAYGNAKDFLPHDICSHINNDVGSSFTDSDYSGVITTLFNDISAVKNGDIVSTENSKNNTDGYSSISGLLSGHLPQSMLILIVSIIIAFLISAYLIRPHGILRSQPVKRIVHTRHLTRQDIYIRTTTRKYDL